MLLPNSTTLNDENWDRFCMSDFLCRKGNLRSSWEKNIVRRDGNWYQRSRLVPSVRLVVYKRFKFAWFDIEKLAQGLIKMRIFRTHGLSLLYILDVVRYFMQVELILADFFDVIMLWVKCSNRQATYFGSFFRLFYIF